MPAQAPTIVAWYRVDDSSKIRSVLLVGSLLLLAGAMATALAIWLRHWDHEPRLFLAVAGACTTALGPLCAIVGLQKILRMDAYLVLRSDGFVRRYEPCPTEFVSWDHLERIVYDARTEHILCLPRQGSGSAVISRSFSGVSLRDLAERMETVRRKATFGLL